MTHWPSDYKGPYAAGDTKEGNPAGWVYNGEVSGYGFEYTNQEPWAVEYRRVQARAFNVALEEAMKDSPLIKFLHTPKETPHG